MQTKKHLICVLLGLLITASWSIAGNVQAADDDSADKQVIPATKSGQQYFPADDAMADLAASFASARENQRLLLVIFGANWCHDSRALASRLYQEPLASLINEHFETLFVDIGYLEKGKEVISSLGVPVYYATPTVLIIDPVTGQLLNAYNRHQWANAAGISMEESLEYFRLFADTDRAAQQSENENDVQLQELLTEIDVFEQVQAERLYQAYAVLTPMITAYQEGDKEAFSTDLWNEVRDYRFRIPADLEALQAEARRRVAAGETDIKLSYPLYPAFSWDPK